MDAEAGSHTAAVEVDVRRFCIQLGRPVAPSDLMRQYRIGFNRACSLLEGLETRGDLARVEGVPMAWRVVEPAKRRGGVIGYSLSLSAKERAALLRLLDATLATWPECAMVEQTADLPTLRAVRARMKREGRKR
jgi:sugar-specific transcriptional regulator TrmB